MTTVATYRISDGAIREARSMGVYGDLPARLARMVHRSVPIPGRKDMRKFMGYQLYFNQDVLTGIAYAETSIRFAATCTCVHAPMKALSMMLRLHRRRLEPDPVHDMNVRQAELLGRLAGRMRDAKCPYTDHELVAAWTRGKLYSQERMRP